MSLRQVDEQGRREPTPCWDAFRWGRLFALVGVGFLHEVPDKGDWAPCFQLACAVG
jgi:hypothetical protein